MWCTQIKVEGRERRDDKLHNLDKESYFYHKKSEKHRSKLQSTYSDAREAMTQHGGPFKNGHGDAGI